MLITMAGRGSRFLEAGYTVPKYMIEAKGKTLFRWSLESLKAMSFQRAVFVVRSEDNARTFIEDECRAIGVRDPVVVEIGHMTNGQATTAMLAIPHCTPGEPVAIFNIDTHVGGTGIPSPSRDLDGYIPCFGAEGSHWSFVRLHDETGDAVEVREKVRISGLATIGLYWFRSPELYADLYRRHFSGGDAGFERGEAYIAPMYNLLIADGGRIRTSLIPAEHVVPLGTPAELSIFLLAP